MSSSSSVISSLSWDSMMLLLGEILTLGPSVTKYLSMRYSSHSPTHGDSLCPCPDPIHHHPHTQPYGKQEDTSNKQGEAEIISTLFCMGKSITRLVDGVKQEDILLILLNRWSSGLFHFLSFSNLLKFLYQFYYNRGISFCLLLLHKASPNLDPLNAPKSRARPGPHLSNPQCDQLGWQILLFRFVTLPSCRKNCQTVTASLTYPEHCGETQNQEDPPVLRFYHSLPAPSCLHSLTPMCTENTGVNIIPDSAHTNTTNIFITIEL